MVCLKILTVIVSPVSKLQFLGWIYCNNCIIFDKQISKARGNDQQNQNFDEPVNNFVLNFTLLVIFQIENLLDWGSFGLLDYHT